MLRGGSRILKGGSNSRQQSLGWKCTPSMQSMPELGDLGVCSPPRNFSKIDTKIL